MQLWNWILKEQFLCIFSILYKDFLIVILNSEMQLTDYDQMQISPLNLCSPTRRII